MFHDMSHKVWVISFYTMNSLMDSLLEPKWDKIRKNDVYIDNSGNFKIRI